MASSECRLCGKECSDGHEAVFDGFGAEALVDHVEATEAEEDDESFAAAFHDLSEVLDGAAAAAQSGGIVVGGGVVGGLEPRRFGRGGVLARGMQEGFDRAREGLRSVRPTQRRRFCADS